LLDSLLQEIKMSPSKKRRNTSSSQNTIDDDGRGGDDINNEPNVNNQSSDEKREVRNRMREITTKLDQIRRDKNANELREVIANANTIIVDIKETGLAMEDARMFVKLCKTVKEFGEDTSTNESKFSMASFANNIGRKLNAPKAVGGGGGEAHRLNRANLVELGTKYRDISKRAPTLKFVLGALNTELEGGEKKSANQRRASVASKSRPKIAAATATKIAIVEKSQTTEAKTDKYVKLTLRCLEDHYKKNAKTPICYFKFVIDPDSFGKTVENMFHVSFLVKQRVALLAIGANGLPTLEPLNVGRYEDDDDDDDEESVVSDQAVISICQNDWIELKTNLNITKKMININ